jgi:hypothetical protein
MHAHIMFAAVWRTWEGANQWIWRSFARLLGHSLEPLIPQLTKAHKHTPVHWETIYDMLDQYIDRKSAL